MDHTILELLDKYGVIYNEEEGSIFCIEKEFCDNRLTDAVLAKLSGLKYIKEIELVKCAKVTGSFFDNLIHQQIASIKMIACPISDQGVKYLPYFAKLESLVITGADISDNGFSFISACDKLTYLQVRSGNVITDKGLLNLSNLKDLKILETYLPYVSQAAYDRLRVELPNCQVG